MEIAREQVEKAVLNTLEELCWIDIHRSDSVEEPASRPSEAGGSISDVVDCLTKHLNDVTSK